MKTLIELYEDRRPKEKLESVLVGPVYGLYCCCTDAVS